MTSVHYDRFLSIILENCIVIGPRIVLALYMESRDIFTQYYESVNRVILLI